ncbi:MAG: GNAT family N-acetyltransferase [Clostridia bacterium]|nr:GNAT family N-acetyltransferase [Clostridia bacterium]MBQ4620320.1 GNAT family N-acetyltransferase [Clostridia bacterium]
MGRLIGNRVMLREYRQEDLSALRAWVNDTETTRYLAGSYRRPQTWEQTEEWLMRRLNGDAGGEGYVIADKETQKYLGQIDLMMIDPIARKAEMAIVLMLQAQKKGYALESIRLILAYAFYTMNLNRVWLKCAEKNEAAVRCYERAGFKTEGVLRNDLYIDGEYTNALIMGILKEEFHP